MNGFFIGCADLTWNEVVKRLVERGCKFDYISGIASQTEGIQFNNETIFHDYLDALRGIRPQGFELAEQALDAEILEQYYTAETACMEISDRMDKSYSFSYQERIRLYFSVLGFWLYMIERYEPKFVVFPQTPHAVYDIVLYHVAKKKGIKIFMLLPIVALKLMLPFSELEDPTKGVVKTYRNYLQNVDMDMKMSDFHSEYMQRHSGDYESAMPAYLKQRLENECVNNKRSWRDYVRKLATIARYPYYLLLALQLVARKAHNLYSFFFGEAPPNYLKRPGEALEQSYLTCIEYNIYKTKARWYKRKLKEKYDGHVTSIDTSKNYIYVPLQYQPERTTCPEGGRYSNQLLMIRLISSLLPDDWEIVVKENPSQLLSKMLHGERGRYSYYYSDLTSIPKVRVVSIETSQFDLIDGCRAVATLTGTSGWEACVRGKPVMAFGYAWYVGCEGVFRVSNQSECELAIQAIASGVKVNEKNVQKFLKALEHHSIEGYPNIKIAAGDKSGVKNNVSNIIEKLESFLIDSDK